MVCGVKGVASASPLAAVRGTFRWGDFHPGTHLTGQIASMILHPNPYMDVNLFPYPSPRDCYHRSAIADRLLVIRLHPYNITSTISFWFLVHGLQLVTASGDLFVLCTYLTITMN